MNREELVERLDRFSKEPNLFKIAKHGAELGGYWDQTDKERQSLIINLYDHVIGLYKHITDSDKSHLSTFDRIDQLEAEKNSDKKRLQRAEELLREFLDNVYEEVFDEDSDLYDSACIHCGRYMISDHDKNCVVAQTESFLTEVEG